MCTFLNKLTKKIEETLQQVAKQVSARSVKRIIADKSTANIEPIKEELNQKYYRYVISTMPIEFSHQLSYEHFKEIFRITETQSIITQQVNVLANSDLKQV